jgi:hypothetical protein
VESAEARVIVKAFELRAAGRPVKEVRAHLAANGIERSWHGVQHLLKSKLYLGEIHFGELVNKHAHPAIVEPRLWREAQSTEVRGPRTPSDALLARLGVLVCGTCGSRMSVGTQTQRGRKYPFYKCNPLGDCPNRQAVGATIAETVVIEAVRERLTDTGGWVTPERTVRDAEEELRAAQEALDGAIRLLAGFEDEDAARDRLEALRETRDRAIERMAQVGHHGDAQVVEDADEWDTLDLDARRQLVRAVVQRAVVSPGRGAGRVSVELFG